MTKGEQGGSTERLYQCTDGVMRTAYERIRFEKRVRWTWLGFIVLPETDSANGEQGR